jgi:DNA recombination protein RmuC
MVDRCHFREQPSVEVLDDEDPVSQRADMAVDLPGDKVVVVDSKVPLVSYMDALDAVGEERETLMDRFGQHVREHVRMLGSKAYWSHSRRAPNSL